jgi:phosphatidyl-myo-inositol dimannoside synthase
MRVLLTSDARFERTPDGVVWGPPAYGLPLWRRYLEVFSSALVAARVADVGEPSAGSVRASDPLVEFCRLPSYAGASGLLRCVPRLCRAVAAGLDAAPALIVRAPSPLAWLVGRTATAAARPFAAEIVGDSDQVFSPGAFRHPLRGAIRQVAVRAERQIARDAVAVLYVTREILQRRYPTGGLAFAASDAVLDDAAFEESVRPGLGAAASFVIVAVGGLDQPFKGTGVLLQAVARLRRAGARVTLRIVGGGRLLPMFRQEAERLGIGACVEFLGQQDRTGVRDALDSAHLFVLPSLTEGLPRALLEAMARGLAAVATRVGGVPELLPDSCLVTPRDAVALADRIGQMMADQGTMRRLGEQNRELARRHHERLQAPVRREFLRAVSRASANGIQEARCA